MNDSYRTETRESGNMKFRIDWTHDTDADAPWEQCDGHGIVSDWTTRSKRPGEMVLCADSRSHRFYDFAESVKLARHDGWDTEPYGTRKPGERAHAATMANFEYLRKWCNDQWFYCGITVSLLDIEGNSDVSESLWGIEDGLPEMSEHHEEVIRDLMAGCMAQISATIGE